MTRRAVILGAAALVLLLSGCQAIVVETDGSVTSSASRAVAPTTAVVGGARVAAIEIRLRDCDRIEWAGEDGELGLRPAAVVTAADGTTLFQSTVYPYLQPSGSQVIEGTEGDADRIVVAVAGAEPPITIESLCTSYAGIYNPPFKTAWLFPTCRTSTRQCPATEAGEGRLYDPPPGPP